MILLVSWIRWLDLIPWPADSFHNQYPPLYMLHEFDQVCMFSPSFFLKSIEQSELYILTCCEILVCLVSQTNPVDWLKGDCYEIYLNLLTSFILVWVLSFFILQVVDRRWNMPKLQVPEWDAKSRVVGRCVPWSLWADSKQTCN